MPAPIPKEKVIADIQRVAEKVGEVPTRRDYDEYGNYSKITPRSKFGSWTAAREAAGLEGGPTKNTYVPDSEILAEIKRVADKIGESPSQEQFNVYGEYTHILVCDRFGRWNNALEKCGLETERDDRIPSEKLLDDIRRVAGIVEAVPSQADMKEYGNHGLSPIKRRFGKWSTAVRKAGFEPYTVGPQPGEENPAWNGGYDPYYGPNWYEQRAKARERDEYQCQDPECDMTDEKHKEKYGCELEVHHIIRAGEFDDYVKMNRLTNLVTLCTPCHQTYESLPNERAKELIEG